jgi:hypothetical protein
MADDPGDINLDKFAPEQPDPGTLESPAAPARPPVMVAIVAGVLLLALIAGYVYLRRAPSQESAPAPQKKAAATTEPQAEPGDQIPLPPLDDTDPLVRDLVGRLSSHPMVARWLTTDGLIQNFVVVTARIADGEIPGSELKKLGPVPPFQTRTSGGMLYLDPASYQRYDRYAQAVSALDARGTARLYATLKPRVGDAYKRLGQPAGDFDAVLERAIVQLLSVPLTSGDIAVEPRGIGYGFADERLERLSPGQKQLLRMGPQNARAVQAKLREIADYLGIPATRLPRP